MTHACFDCEFGNSDFPCQTDGDFDVSKLATAYVANCCSFENDAHGHWSYDCAGTLVRDDAENGWLFLLKVVDALQRQEQAVLLAAGEAENLIYHHGDILIDRIEDQAKESPRFRFVLSGIWPQGQEESVTWQRVLVARSDGPEIDAGDPLPPK